MWFCVFPRTERRKPARETAERTRSTVWLVTVAEQSRTVLGFAHSPMEPNPSLAAKSILSSLKLPRMPSFGFQDFGLAMAAEASPLISVRLVIFGFSKLMLSHCVLAQLK